MSYESCINLSCSTWTKNFLVHAHSCYVDGVDLGGAYNCIYFNTWYVQKIVYWIVLLYGLAQDLCVSLLLPMVDGISEPFQHVLSFYRDGKGVEAPIVSAPPIHLLFLGFVLIFLVVVLHASNRGLHGRALLFIGVATTILPAVFWIPFYLIAACQILIRKKSSAFQEGLIYACSSFIFYYIWNVGLVWAGITYLVLRVMWLIVRRVQDLFLEDGVEPESGIINADNWILRIVSLVVLFISLNLFSWYPMVFVVYLFFRFLYVRIRRPIGVSETFVTNGTGDRERVEYAYVYRGITGWSYLDSWLNPMFGMALGEDMSDEEFKARVAAQVEREEIKREKKRDKYARDLNRAVSEQVKAIEKQRKLRTIRLSDADASSGKQVAGNDVGLDTLTDVPLTRKKTKKSSSVKADSVTKKSTKTKKDKTSIPTGVGASAPSGGPSGGDSDITLESGKQPKDILTKPTKMEDFGPFKLDNCILRTSVGEDGVRDLVVDMSKLIEQYEERKRILAENNQKTNETRLVKNKGKQECRVIENDEQYCELIPLPTLGDGRVRITNRTIVDDTTTVSFSANMKVKQRPIDGSPFVDFGSTKDVVKLWWKTEDGSFVESGTGYFCENKIVTIDHNAYEYEIYGTRMIDPTEPVKLKLSLEVNAMGFYDVPQAWRSDPTTKRPPIKFGKFEDCPTSGECLIVGFPQVNPFNTPGGLVGSVGKFQRTGDIAKASYSSDHGMSGSAVYLIKNGVVTNQIIGTHEGAAGGSNEFRVVSKTVIDAVRNPRAAKRDSDSDATAALIKSLLAKVAEIAPGDDDVNVLVECANRLLPTPFVPEGKKGFDRVKGNLHKYKGTSASTHAKGPVRLRRKFWSTKYNQYIDYGDVDRGFAQYEDWLYENTEDPDNIDWNSEIRAWMEREYGPEDFAHEYPEMDDDNFWIDADDDTYGIHEWTRQKLEEDNREWDRRARVRGKSTLESAKAPARTTFKFGESAQHKNVTFSQPEVQAPAAPTVPKPPTKVPKSEARAAAAVVTEVFPSPGSASPSTKKKAKRARATIPKATWTTLSAEQRKFWGSLSPEAKRENRKEFMRLALEQKALSEQKESSKTGGTISMANLFPALASPSKDAEKGSD